MKRRNLTRGILLFVLLGSVLGSSALAQKSPKDDFNFPKLNAIKMPEVHQAELSNGMQLFLVEDPQYPTVDLRALVRVGSIYEPADKVGLAAITGTVLRTGGTASYSGDEIDRLVETMGGTIETGIEKESGFVYMSILREDLDQGLNILADILMNPQFAPEKIELAKIEQTAWISRRNDDVWNITNREFTALIYGKDNPYARYPEYATINAITREDLVNFYETYFHPNNIILTAWGDFKAADFQQKLENAFGGWPARQTEIPPRPAVKYKFRHTVNYIPKTDLNQTHIWMGHIGGVQSNPDYPALIIMNQILSYDRMFKVIRSQEGLTYAPWGYYGAEYQHPGIFSCGTQTKSETTVYAIRLMLKEIERITREEVTAEELARAKDSFLNSFVFNFDSKRKIVERMMLFAYHDYPLDFIEQVKREVEKVSKSDVLRVAKKYLHPDQLRIMVVGNQADFDEPLAALGEVHEIDISIPEPAIP